MAGKLKSLWAELKGMNMDDPRRIDVQAEINKIENWMINNKEKYGFSITHTTNFHNNGGFSDSYPRSTGFIYYEDIEELKI